MSIFVFYKHNIQLLFIYNTLQKNYTTHDVKYIFLIVLVADSVAITIV